MPKIEPEATGNPAETRRGNDIKRKFFVVHNV